jgi:hypothetical protein
VQIRGEDAAVVIRRRDRGHSVVMPVQHIDLVFEFLGARRCAVPHVHILGDKAQRLLLAATADQDRWAPNRNLCVPNL